MHLVLDEQRLDARINYTILLDDTANKCMLFLMSVFRMEIQRRLGMSPSSLSPASSSPRAQRRRGGHRRQMSDPKIFSQISPIKEDKDLERELDRVSGDTRKISIIIIISSSNSLL